jgi:Spy/CpxP family protein refolding chaperone
MKKSVRNLILATAVATLSAASMHAAVTGSAPSPKMPKGNGGTVVQGGR